MSWFSGLIGGSGKSGGGYVIRNMENDLYIYVSSFDIGEVSLGDATRFNSYDAADSIISQLPGDPSKYYIEKA